MRRDSQDFTQTRDVLLDNKEIDTPLLPKSIKHTYVRWIVLVLASLNCFGLYFCLDNPQALEGVINKTFKIGNVEFGLLYSVYGCPNIILPIFGGVIIDRLGVRVGIAVFSTILIVGQYVCALGAYTVSFDLMILGRTIFGFGGESLGVASCAIAAKWFRGKELSLSLSVILGVSRIGTVIK